ncbi:hypothetical protein EBS40_02845 [bacterium]|nr:hypothetical protein [bacterium]
MTKEWLVTAQGYLKDDKSKQTMLLHDTFKRNSDHEAKQSFLDKFGIAYEIIQVYSVIDTSKYET